MFEKVEWAEGIDVYIRPTDQFKTVTMMMQWETPYEVERAAHRAVLSNVLQDSTKKYPTYRAYKQQLDALYGSTLFTDVTKRKEMHRFVLMSETVHEQLIGENGHLEAWLDFIRETVVAPNVTDGAFDADTVRRERRSVIERLDAVYDDKRRFARRRLLELMRPGEAVSQSTYGTKEALERVTPESLYTEFQRMIEEDHLSIYIVGDVDVASIETMLREALPFERREARAERPVSLRRGDVQEVVEYQQMNQGQLHIGYYAPITRDDERFPAAQVANGLLGGFAHSKLFMNVREKESMAYSISSQYLSQYGLLLIGAGIDAELSDKAIRLITEQVEAIQRGDIHAREMKQTKALLANGIRSALDTPRGQMMVYDQFKEQFPNFSADALIERWDAVTKEEVVDVANEWTREVIYLLRGGEKQ